VVLSSATCGGVGAERKHRGDNEQQQSSHGSPYN
jgi:hypothetical protein